MCLTSYTLHKCAAHCVIQKYEKFRLLLLILEFSIIRYRYLRDIFAVFRICIKRMGDISGPEENRWRVEYLMGKSCGINSSLISPKSGTTVYICHVSKKLFFFISVWHVCLQRGIGMDCGSEIYTPHNWKGIYFLFGHFR